MIGLVLAVTRARVAIRFTVQEIALGAGVVPLAEVVDGLREQRQEERAQRDEGAQVRTAPR